MEWRWKSPTKSGIVSDMKPTEWKVNAKEAGETLQSFLSLKLGISRNRAKALLDQRLVFVNGRRVWMTHHALRKDDRVSATISIPTAPDTPPSIPILFEDNDYLIVNKPAGLLAAGGDSAETLLRQQLNAPELVSVHRLDRDTSGCLWIARTTGAFDAAVELFQDHSLLKLYHAIVLGHVSPPEQTIKTPIDGQPAVTHFKVLDANDQASHLLVKIETGRTHQIRKHLSQAGHTLLGDRTYGTRTALPSSIQSIPRQMLHATTLEFIQPLSKVRVRVTAPLPADFRRVLLRMRLR